MVRDDSSDRARSSQTDELESSSMTEEPLATNVAASAATRRFSSEACSSRKTASASCSPLATATTVPLWSWTMLLCSSTATSR